MSMKKSVKLNFNGDICVPLFAQMILLFPATHVLSIGLHLGDNLASGPIRVGS